MTSVEVVPLWQASLGWTSVSLPRTAVAVDPRTGAVAASAHGDGGAIELELVGTPVVPAFDLSMPLPFGPGWISWHVAPRLRLEGALALDGRPLELTGASGYHDHNWGRWHWGDDIGWQWGAFLAPAPALAVVLSRGTDRLHRRGEPVLTLHGHDRMWTFRGGCVAVHREGWFDGPLVRVPGAMAALQAGRRRPRLPTVVRVTADDGYDRLELRFEVSGAAQIIAADPHRRGYSFNHELVGRFAGHGRTGGRSWRLRGLGVFEHVD